MPYEKKGSWGAPRVPKGSKIQKSALGLVIGRINGNFKSLKKIDDRIVKDIESRYNDIIKKSTTYLKFVITKWVRNSAVFKALISGSGGKGQDLQAEFGIKASEAIRAAQLLIPILHDTIHVEVKTKQKSNEGTFDYPIGVPFAQASPSIFTFTIKCKVLAKEEFYDKLTSSAPFKYYAVPFVRSPGSHFTARMDRFADASEAFFENKKISAKKKAEAIEKGYKKQRRGESVQGDWMEWLLNAGRGTSFMKRSKGFESLSDFGIKYDLTPGQQKYSRSGRALMYEATTRTFSNIQTDEGGIVRVGKDYTASGKKVYNPNDPNDIGSSSSSKFRPMDNKGTQYKFPEVARPSSGGMNFIEDIIRDPKFKDQINKGLAKILKDILSTKNSKYFT